MQVLKKKIEKYPRTGAVNAQGLLLGNTLNTVLSLLESGCVNQVAR